VEEALPNLVYCEDQLAAHRANVETHTSSFKVANSRLRRAT
jgi:hypothetical protein